MKKPYLCTITGSSGRYCFNYLISTLWFQGLVCLYHPHLHIEKKLGNININIIKVLSNLSIIIPNQKAADIIL